MLFRVHGTLATEIEIVGGSKSNSKSKQFELAGEDGQQLHCTFMEIDREVANVRKGERVVVTRGTEYVAAWQPGCQALFFWQALFYELM